MTATIISSKNTTIHWADIIEYSQTQVKSKILLEDRSCRYSLMSIAVGMHIAEHSSSRNATVNVIEGQGVLTLEGTEIVLQSGVFVFVPATARHAIKAVTNLAFLLTLSEQVGDSNHSS